MTCFANRKNQIRALQAAHPGMAYGEAARQVDTTNNTADLLAGLRQTPMVALAAALNTAGEFDYAARLARSLAREQAPDPEAERLARATEDAYRAMIGAPAGLSAAGHEALNKAYNDADNAQYHHSPDDYPYEDEQAVVQAAFTALSLAADLTDGAPALARAAADVLATLRFDFTADAIRGYREDFGAVPVSADNPAARHARAAVEALADATEIQYGGDEEWQGCIDLLDQALRHATTAAAG
ncbi:hypothetical protein [Amycolatopsis sp. cmx-4-54]|uniref:hypothetical protein n=1 Tax=Amycolatopsis sp. cmx-4-54 TaxID=2790936 RepID=UPI00397C0C9D